MWEVWFDKFNFTLGIVKLVNDNFLLTLCISRDSVNCSRTSIGNEDCKPLYTISSFLILMWFWRGIHSNLRNMSTKAVSVFASRIRWATRFCNFSKSSINSRHALPQIDQQKKWGWLKSERNLIFELIGKLWWIRLNKYCLEFTMWYTFSICFSHFRWLSKVILKSLPHVTSSISSQLLLISN